MVLLNGQMSTNPPCRLRLFCTSFHKSSKATKWCTSTAASIRIGRSPGLSNACKRICLVGYSRAITSVFSPKSAPEKITGLFFSRLFRCLNAAVIQTPLSRVSPRDHAIMLVWFLYASYRLSILLSKSGANSWSVATATCCVDNGMRLASHTT